MQLQQQPFLAIEEESRHHHALAAISLACLLLVIAKGSSLLPYWQQTHHILMEVNSPPNIGKLVPGNQQFSRWVVDTNRWLDERSDRMLLAGQLLLAGDAALPEPELPVVEIPKCPAPVAPKAPVCPPIAVAPAPPTNASPNTQPETPMVANISIASEHPATASPVNTTGEATTTADVPHPIVDLTTLPEPTEEELAAASAPIGLQSGDRILLVGDSLMQGVAPHLITALKRNYKVESMDLSRHSTGLTYPAFFDWPATVKAAFELEQYQVVIVFLGANDPWDMNMQGKYVRFGSERWKEVYSTRVKQIIQTAAEHNARLVWLGAPPMGREDLIGKEPLLNEIYASETAKYPLFARFVATAPSLTQDGSNFTKFMELPERGSVMVRTDDGVHFTIQGQKLLAKLTLKQFTKVARQTLPVETQPTTEPAAPTETHPTASPAPTGEPPPNTQQDPAISQR
ncbi:MAG TPA: DUF459 domain-containing protein [Cellvibrio sp.]|nr:DUF459 domain-containing protein [Cellvibrio sp.]